MNFIALQVISQIDDIIFKSVSGEPLKDAITKDAPIITMTTRMIREEQVSKPRHWSWKMSRALYKVQKFIFAAYFYFSPFIVLIVAFQTEKE